MRSGESTSELGQFCGLDTPFANSLYDFLSPVHGANRSMFSIRTAGHNGSEEVASLKRFKRPKGLVVDGNPPPQDVIALLAERFFPSMAGLVLTSPADRIHEYLTPKNAAKIFVETAKPGFFDNEDPEETFCLIRTENISAKKIRYYQPDYVEGQGDSKIQLKVNKGVGSILKILVPAKILKTKEIVDHKWNAKSRNKIDYKPDANDTASILHAYELSLLLYSAFKLAKEKESDYPPHVVEQLILMFLWEKYHKDRNQFDIYCDILADAEMIDRELVNKMKTAKKRCYTEENFLHAELKRIGGSDEDVATPLEYAALLNISRTYFKEKYAPVVGFGRCERMIKRVKTFYSDCGDTLLRNYFMMMLLNEETGEFDVTGLLVKLKIPWVSLYNEKAERHEIKISQEVETKYPHLTKLIRYFTEFCRRPADAETQIARNEWGNVVNDLNRENDPYPIRYISDTYEIDVGLDNIMRVVAKLLGEPKELDLAMKRKIDVVKNMGFFNSLFSRGEKSWTLYFDFYDGNIHCEVGDLFEPVPATGWFGFSIMFSYGLWHTRDRDIFQMHFMPNHFDANKVIYNRTIDDIMQRMTLRMQVYKLKYGYYPYGTLDDIYESPLNSIEQRYAVLKKMMFYRQNHPHAFHYLLKTWIEHHGYHFGGWQNPAIVKQVIDALYICHTTENIMDYHIQPFFDALVWRHIAENHTEEAKRILKVEAELFGVVTAHDTKARALTQSLRNCNNDQFVLLILAGGNDYAQTVTGASLLHHAAAWNCHHLKSSLNKLDQDVNTRSKADLTPLHTTILHGSDDMAEYLMSRGADINALSPDGKSPLFLVAEELDKRFKNEEIEVHLLPNILGFSKNKKLKALVNIFELLIWSGADYTAVYKNNQTYLEWAQSCVNTCAGNLKWPYAILNLMTSMHKRELTHGISFPPFIYLMYPFGVLDDDCISIQQNSLEDLERLADAALADNQYNLAKRYSEKMTVCYGLIGLLYLFNIELAIVERDHARNKEVDKQCNLALKYLFLAEILLKDNPEEALANVPSAMKQQICQERYWTESKSRLFTYTDTSTCNEINAKIAAELSYKNRFEAITNALTFKKI